MAGLSSRRRALVASVLALALVGGGLALSAGASSPPNLPAITPMRLVASTLAAMRAHSPQSGDALAKIDIGLPSIPGAESMGSNSPVATLSSLAGDHRIRVWHSADGLRVADLTRYGERALFVSRTDAWAWDSDTYTAYHLGSAYGRMDAKGSPVPTGAPDPQTVARQVLAMISPSTSVVMAPARRVAGRDAYVLRLTPRTPGTLVGKIEVAVDAQHRLPLSIEVFARNHSNPSLSFGYRTVSFDPIDPATYRFTPPPGAAVRQPKTTPAAEAHPDPGSASESPFEYLGSGVQTFGADWSTIVAIRTPPSSQVFRGKQGQQLRQFLPFAGPLLSINLVDRGDHGWLVYGAVPPSALGQVESRLP